MNPLSLKAQVRNTKGREGSLKGVELGGVVSAATQSIGNNPGVVDDIGFGLGKEFKTSFDVNNFCLSFFYHFFVDLELVATIFVNFGGELGEVVGATTTEGVGVGLGVSIVWAPVTLFKGIVTIPAGSIQETCGRMRSGNDVDIIFTQQLFHILLDDLDRLCPLVATGVIRHDDMERGGSFAFQFFQSLLLVFQS